MAPESEQSGSSHSLTLKRPLRIRRVSGKQFAVDGTPTDCILLAIAEIMNKNQPDLVISGINRGGNLGGDITYSGTIAGAMEGTLLGIKSIALSQVYDRGNAIPWATSRHWTPKVLSFLSKIEFAPGVLMNINFPPVKFNEVLGMTGTMQGEGKIGDEISVSCDPRDEKYFWIGPQKLEKKCKKGTDLYAISKNMISITPLSLNLTDTLSLKYLKRSIKNAM